MDRPTQGARPPSRQSLPAWINSDVSQVVSLHCPRRYLLQKYTSSGQSEHAFHSIPGRKTLLQKKKFIFCQDKSFSLMLAHPLCANGFFQPRIILFPEISFFLFFVFCFPHERWWPLSVPCWGVVRGSGATLPRCLLCLPNVPLVWEVEEGGRWQRCPIDGAVTKEPLASHHHLQPRGKKLGAHGSWWPPPESPLTPAPRAQTEGEHLELSTEDQAPRDSGASEQGSFHRTGSLGQTHGL